MLARELTDRPDHPLLNDLILCLAPIYNADGNERVAPDNRPGQDGPGEGMGERDERPGLDLNRDFISSSPRDPRPRPVPRTSGTRTCSSTPTRPTARPTAT